MSTTFTNDDRQRPNQRKKQSQYQGFAVNKNMTNNRFMVRPDGRNKIPTHNERFLDQSIEEVEQTLYKTKRTSY